MPSLSLLVTLDDLARRRPIWPGDGIICIPVSNHGGLPLVNSIKPDSYAVCMDSDECVPVCSLSVCRPRYMCSV